MYLVSVCYGGVFKADNCPLNIDRYLVHLTNREEFKAHTHNRQQNLQRKHLRHLYFPKGNLLGG
jgi:hypothetical protein